MKTRLAVCLCLLASGSALAEAISNHGHVLELKNTGHAAARDAIYPLYEKDLDAIRHVRDSRGEYLFIDHDARDFLYIDTYDLNGDGVPEIFVHFISRYSCGAHGCAFSVYQKQKDGGYRDIVTPMIFREESRFAISKRLTNGYHDIYVTDVLAVEPQNIPVDAVERPPIGVLNWDGTQYRYTVLGASGTIVTALSWRKQTKGTPYDLSTRLACFAEGGQ